MSGFGLADLFDLEIRTLEEKNESEDTRRSRYRHLGRRVLEKGGSADDSGSLLQAMLRLDAAPRTPGSRVEMAVRWFNRLVALTGGLVGVSVSLALLHYTGEHPVNILNALAGLVGVQLSLLALLLVALLLGRRPGPPGPVHGAFRLGLRRFGTGFLPDALRQRWTVLEDRMDAHRGLWRWLLVRAAQIFGVSFNLGALAGCLYRVILSDVAFGWSTTLHLNAGTVHAGAKALASPWGWLFPQAVPSEELVALTQYSHLEGKYLLRSAGERSLGPGMVGGWWPFLILSLGTYGLLPRLLVLICSELHIRRILRDTPDRNEEFRRIAEWMRLPVVTTLAPGSEGIPTVPPAGRSEPDPALPPPGSSCEVLVGGAVQVDRHALERIVRDRFGWTVTAATDAPGFDPGRGGPDTPIVVLVSAWEEPTKGNQRPFQRLPQGRLVIVGLVASTDMERQDPRLEKIRERWRRHLHSSRADLRLRVEPLGLPS
jgi:hypothetical protein